ncbi:Aldehyde dehydrogenase, dimeric NADP-preferring,Aldehyde dehydrogenase,Aldehyde dehydrogenase family 3 member B2,Fatty aldehyde dehydrogenase,Aldehyde dehydrogenase family 3 member B3,Aldehyde dehydrogenase family 3 member I1, chloroplastic,Aldehyde dehydrogenase family 3 member B1,Aldehyde dehydrogenase family 3 member H1,Aldehyde dehydrogenase family 3 comG [Mytilus coruscus]|uniref:Aldehyde dehydrogenase n=1 Tax=Mytilus coruscus TaxID=42192 RepID=A0A6J8C9V2_MYTCO|nr:Aldehyde dehydrogenase, dimeric NADP-preferring,Aldehyde dehydrogenase,Aldehyde dehydrogenase family 3 member B2,Fatty aldehyde dehydrogenase,Aldehyde dehydrogenase family 3 member B3,Aldehyde dehydrogenase family 3 member I1, chloroplastic,Aldehyde dehydrogenase family 3 member B1,Aldehyde dehydrogenase family 3 member H1,Aldehyde dehydrogenase family 3 comG [Mytilus coruscus]
MAYYTELVEQLRAAYRTGKTKSYEWRRQQLEGVLKLLDENKEEIVISLKNDLHKPLLEAFFEIDQCRNDLIDTMNNLKEWMKPQKVQKPLINIMDKAFIQKQPYGVVLVIGTWNFPVMLTLMPMFGAFAAGNCVLLKTSRISSSTSHVLEKLVPKYLDKDCVKIVNGGSGEIAVLLKERYDYIFYTGNTSVGKIVMNAASQYLTPVTLELGGKNPVYVDTNCDYKAVANRLLWGKTINAGQTCISPDYVMCTKDIQGELIQAMKITINAFYQGDPYSSGSYGRLGNDRNFQRVKKIIDSSKDNIAIGGITNEKEYYVSPTVLQDVKFTDPAMQEEMFGPVLPIIPVNNAEEAIEYIVNGEKPLVMYIFSNNKTVKEKFSNSTSSGGLVINDTMLHAGVMTLPFGGVGNSGLGAYHGKLTFDTFSHNRACLERQLILEGLQSIRYPPYTQKKINIIQRVTKKELHQLSFMSPWSFLVIGMIAAAFLLKV